MTEIAGPTISQDHPDRHILCQDAMHSAIQSVIAEAVGAGWCEREVAAAIIELADNHMLSVAANDETGALIQLLKRMT
jgi:hypothetical protein